MLKTIDLFAGAGGLSYGFVMSGKYKIVAAAELNKNAQRTYLRNIPHDDNFVMIDNVIGYDFSNLNTKFQGIDVVIGGPPCQGFSNANRQKTHLISMNNSLVKEYFRAIKEIKPKAFVMENVSMLQSDKHRFYESYKDKGQIDDLKSKGYEIPFRMERILIAKEVYKELDTSDPTSSVRNGTLFPEELFQLLNVLYKNLSNNEKLTKYYSKNIKTIKKQIASYVMTVDSLPSLQSIISMLRTIESSNRIDDVVENSEQLEYIIGLQKALNTIKEIDDNDLAGEYSVNDKNELVYSVNSYSVIDYIQAVLGGEYVQKGTVFCAEKYGVPQERRRYLVIGIRKDQLEGDGLELPAESDHEGPIVSVGDAINDLQEYEVGYDPSYGEIPYHKSDEFSCYAKIMRENSCSVKNHIVTKTRETALKRFRSIEQGKNFHSLPPEQKKTYSKPERTQNTIYLRLDPTKPCGTVVNVRKSMWIHPYLDRAISVREAARLQSFPDEFEFMGTKDSQYQQVGNAVPPLLAKRIAEYISNILQIL